MVELLNDRFLLNRSDPVVAGQSRVYEATDGVTRERVAVKILRHDVASSEDEELFYDRELASLQKLRHENIVELIDFGVAGDDRFIVLEWMDSTLKELLTQWRLEDDWGWDRFAEAVGLPLLAGLEHAHEREIVHRDIKPANVLVSSSGIPKLADFGISKIKSQLTSDFTLAHYQSAPYAPPDEQSQSNYSRDVFALALLMINAVSDQPADDYPEIPIALNELDAPGGVLDLLERCVSYDPKDRPANASVFAAELGRLQRPRLERFQERDTLHLKLTKNLRIILSGSPEGLSEPEARTLVTEDLAFGAFIEWQRVFDGTAEYSEEYVWIFGEQWRYTGVRDQAGPYLVLTTAKRLRQREVDRARDEGWEAPFALKFTPPLSHAKAQASRDAFLVQLDEFHEQRRIATLDLEERRLFNQWHAELRAQEHLARGSALPLQYAVTEIEGRRIHMRLDREPEEDLVEQERSVETTDGRRRAAGVVESVDGDRLVLYLERPDSAVPKRGRLVVNAQLALSALRRQKEALAAVQHGDVGVERPELKSLLVHPESSAAVGSPDSVEWIQPQLDDDKKDAVCRALAARDFVLVEGPPGTGKTTFIAELVGQVLRENPNSRILVSSQTHVALDNALERISELLPEARLIRLARTGDPRVAPGVEGLLVDAQRARWVKSVRKKSEQFLRQWAVENGADLAATRVALSLTELIAVKRQLTYLQGQSHALREQLRAAESYVGRGEAPPDALTDTEHLELEEALADYRDRQAELRREVDRLVPGLSTLGTSAERLAKASIDELNKLMPVAVGATGAGGELFEQLVRLQGEWLERVGVGSQFHAALLFATEVVAGTCVGLAGFKGMREVPFDLCILDEASKATATEALVPLSRARKWIVVGDRRQLPPYQDDALSAGATLEEFELDAAELGRTIFDRLAEGLPEAAKTMLRTQHRMVRPIGNLVSECFYEGDLLSATDDDQPALRRALEEPVTWVDTSPLPSRREKPAGVEGKSFVNRLEAALIATRLQRLSFVAQSTNWESERGRKLSVMVLTGYRPQVTAIKQSLARHADKVKALQIEVNTIDAAQGREADVAVFSVTRSNERREGGFLGRSPRINVAVSRGKFGLIVVGDITFAAAIGGPLGEVATYLRGGRAGTAVVSAED